MQHGKKLFILGQNLVIKHCTAQIWPYQIQTGRGNVAAHHYEKLQFIWFEVSHDPQQNGLFIHTLGADLSLLIRINHAALRTAFLPPLDIQVFPGDFLFFLNLLQQPVQPHESFHFCVGKLTQIPFRAVNLSHQHAGADLTENLQLLHPFQVIQQYRRLPCFFFFQRPAIVTT